jgi:phage FluMu protein Com
MNPIQFECPHCDEIIAGDESLYGQRVKCPKCQATILVPSAPVYAESETARLIPQPAASGPVVVDGAKQETDIFKLTPVARAYVPRLRHDKEPVAWRRIYTRRRNLLLPGLCGRHRLHLQRNYPARFLP